jgi:hypothetical protein
VPGTVEWLRGIEGPRLVQRLLDEVHANAIGEMTPTQARCASMLLDRALPTLTAVHHTMETSLSAMSEADILRRLQQLTGQTIDVKAQVIKTGEESK